MYQYYADVAPAAAKMLRFLLLLPGGDRTEGLAQMLRARTRGTPAAGRGRLPAPVIYLWYEHRDRPRVELLESLHERYPGNPLFLAQLAEIQDRYQHDITASLAPGATLLAAAREQRVNEAELAEVAGPARHRPPARRALPDRSRASSSCAQVVDAQAGEAVSARWPRRTSRSAKREDRLGHRDAAVAAYRAAVNAVPAPDPQEIRSARRSGCSHAPDADARRGLSPLARGLPQARERSDLAGRRAALARSVALDPDDPVARYRYGRVARRRDGRTAPALAQFELTHPRRAQSCPAPIAAAAYLEAARLHERLGHRDEAIDYYRAAATWFGGERATRAPRRIAR